jgi:hypothetical protein
MSDQPAVSPSPSSEISPEEDGSAGRRAEAEGRSIQFDKAEYDSKEAPVCTSCKKAIGGRYYQLNGKPFCDRCHDLVLAHFDRKLSAAQKLVGAVLVFGAVLGCAAGWYAIREATGYEIGLIAIGVAYVIAKALRRASGGLGSRGLQIAAVALTYLAIAGANVPIIVKTMLHTQEEKESAVAAPSDPPVAPAAKPSAHPAAPGPAAVGAPVAEKAPAVPAPAKTPDMNPFLGLSLFALIVLGLALAAPFLALPENFLGVLIIGIALYQAWRLMAPVQLNWEGPLSFEPPAALPSPVPPATPAVESVSGG